MLEEMGDKLVIKCERNEPCHPLQKQMPQCPFKYYYYLYYRELCVNIIFLLLNKNSHILPTGQWYAPSAVINDALIMQ